MKRRWTSYKENMCNIFSLTDQLKYLNVWQIYILYLKLYPDYTKGHAIYQVAYFHGLYPLLYL